jgi:hypothetical protein
MGNRHVNLGLSDELLSSTEPETVLLGRASASNELLRYLNDIENLLRKEEDYSEFFRNRETTVSALAGSFRAQAFRELKLRVRDIAKPTKQLLVRYNTAAVVSREGDLPDDARIASAGGASDMFGKRQGDPLLFARVVDPISGAERFETKWKAFKAAVGSHEYGSYWCGLIARAAIAATTEGTEWDQNLVLISNRHQRHRVISTTVTTYFNNDAEVSLYLIEALQRPDYGDPDTTKCLKCLNMICRFRFAFLEERSPYYWRNFQPSDGDVKAAFGLLMELDLLKSEAQHANLEMPGAWEEFMSAAQLNAMITTWKNVEVELRAACGSALERNVVVEPAASWTERVSSQLKRINEDIRPFNTLLGVAISARLKEYFDHQVQGSSP